MSPGSPDDLGAEGPRRINWNRLPGPGDDADGPPPPHSRPLRGATPADGPSRAGSTPPGVPNRGSTPPGGVPRPPQPPPGRRPRVGVGRTGSQPQVTGAHRNVQPNAAGQSKKRKPGKGGEPESRLSQPHKRHYLSLWVELPLLLIVAFSAAVLLRTFAVQPFYIPSGSMEQTLQEGDKVLVLKLTQTLRSPQRGEVVVFRGTDQWDPEFRPAASGSFLSDFGTAVLDLVGLAEPNEKDFIKRVIAVGGDTVSCCDAEGNVQVNGISLDEDEYVYDNAPLDVEPGSCHSRQFEELAVPEGHVWVMGDHRGNSQDSRCQGPVPVENIIGRAIALVWPTDRVRDLEIPSSFDVLDGTTGGTGENGGTDEAPEGEEADAAAGHQAGLGAHENLPPALPASATAPELAGRPRRLAP
ncbi:signal peptidase I [Glycomyces sp. L485]|uniref:signal peptidase I n=1 Tax=Glycomyces sp. L485 TaxID=2909235 RepID=UPI001F4B31CB|nr:signal peptidase I [Glycomyces sp. L485]MCH7231725.1 signal peptidase I [Glycomyces sp. L485]